MPINLPDNISSGHKAGLRERLDLAFHHFRLTLEPDFDPDPIFVLGTGRSGTHWVAWILEPHCELRTLIEKPPIFEWATEMAIDPEAEERLFGRLAHRYRLEASRARPLRLLDKSHPNIWMAERLAEEFPRAQFIGVLRDAYGTVASSLRHSGVRHWVERWNDYPVPNRFLGITRDNVDDYRDYDTVGRSTVRWLAHLERLDELENALGDRMIRLRYDRLHRETDAELDRLARFLDLDEPIPFPDVKADSLERWKRELTPSQVETIRSIAGERASRQ